MRVAVLRAVLGVLGAAYGAGCAKRAQSESVNKIERSSAPTPAEEPVLPPRSVHPKDESVSEQGVGDAVDDGQHSIEETGRAIREIQQVIRDAQQGRIEPADGGTAADGAATGGDD